MTKVQVFAFVKQTWDTYKKYSVDSNSKVILTFNFFTSSVFMESFSPIKSSKHF